MKSDRSDSMRRAGREELDNRYGKIGISAVAAALHYPSDAKNPHHRDKNDTKTAPAADGTQDDVAT